MELVYLWVEEYKNIHKQGFNFSGKYQCDYNPDTNELTIDKDKDYLHLFPKKINVTAIVGKNGSGKSNILHLIIGSIFQNFDNWREINNFYMVFKKNNDFIIAYDEVLDARIPKKYKTISFTNLKQELYVSLFDFSLVQPHVWNEDNNYKVNYSLEPSVDYQGAGPNGLSKIIPISFDSNLSSLATYFYKYIDDEILTHNNIDKYDLIKVKYARKINVKFLENETKIILDYYKNHATLFGITQQQFLDKKVLPEYQEFNIREISEEEIELIAYIDLFFQIELACSDDKNLSFYNLSLGHKMLIANLGLILKTIKKRANGKNIVFLLDEIETSLHPNWQRNIITLFTNVFKNHEQKLHFIFASHSPFLLSDLQSENCIFLQKTTNGMKVLSSLVDKKQTFGANIHTLLSDAFFMEDGLIGEFAKRKINEILNYLNDNESEITDNKTAQKHINLIGEPILKRQLQKMLDSKRISRIDEIDELKKRIALLESKQ